MNRQPARRLPLYIVLIFSMCLCNLVLREFAVNWENCLACRDPQNLAEHGGVAGIAHIHDHEHDIIPAVLAAPQTRIGAAREIGTVNLPSCSHLPSPLLPPPKAA
jgi:hypothetical protein